VGRFEDNAAREEEEGFVELERDVERLRTDKKGIGGKNRSADFREEELIADDGPESSGQETGRPASSREADRNWCSEHACRWDKLGKETGSFWRLWRSRAFGR
jgi:hypothetical protein